MKHDELQDLMELAARRPLEPAELDRLNRLLEADPQAWPDREEDMALTRAMRHLPDAPLASNFSARVMQAIEIAERNGQRERRPFGLRWWRYSWLARLGFASCVGLVAVVGWQRHQTNTERADVAESVAALSEIAAGPSVEILKDTDAILSFGKVPPAADVEADQLLLTALSDE